jgi:endonuclease/exonuclease/phosphatase (EEP) superfamily protein YafD
VLKSLRGAAAATLMGARAPTVNLLNPTRPRFQGTFAGRPEARAADRETLRVVSFNVKFGDSIGAAVEVLRSDALRHADIISLQEMDEKGTEQIARSLHLNYVYYPGSIHPARGRYFGPAILTRWPIEKDWKVILPHEGRVRRQRRNATAAVVMVGDTPVQFYAVHLETQSRASDHERRDQVAAVLADATTAPGPVVVAGDFNSRGIGNYFERQGFAWPTRRVGKTISLFSWDHIFAKGLAVLGSTAGKVSDVRGASDHRPVWASMIIAGAEASEALGELAAPPRWPPHARRSPTGG